MKGEAEVGGLEGVVNGARESVELCEVGGAGDGDFADAAGVGVGAGEDEGAVRAEADDGFQKFVSEGGAASADDLAASAGGVGEWAEEVEEGGESEGVADGGGVFHGGVMCGGEGEADVGGAEAGGFLFRGGVDVDAEGAEDVGGAGAGRDRAVAVLADGNTTGGGDDGGGGGDVEERGVDAAGAAGVDDVVRGVDGDHMAAHDGGCAGEFIDGGFTCREEGEERSGLERVGEAVHDVGEGGFGLGSGERGAVEELLEEMFHRDDYNGRAAKGEDNQIPSVRTQPSLLAVALGRHGLWEGFERRKAVGMCTLPALPEAVGVMCMRFD